MSFDRAGNSNFPSDSFFDAGNETKFGLQADRETDGRSYPDRPPPWKAGDQLGDFVLDELLGRGSSGWVFRAFDTSDNNTAVALKLLRPDSPDKMLWNKLGFRRMMSVEHQHLVRVGRIYQFDQYVGLSMEEVDGQTFAQARKSLLTMEPADAFDQLLEMLRQFASGLAVMHDRGLLHRDMKPANMMIDNTGSAKIIDYGLVAHFQMNAEDCLPRGHILGTPRYIAPEVYWSQRYLPSGDIFCLGIVFLETLLGIQNHAGSKWTELERSKKYDEDQQRISDAIEDLEESVPSAILSTCREMLSRQPADRPRATELARIGHRKSNAVAIPVSHAIIGREHELTQVKSWIKDIFNGKVGRFHVCGPSGIGKSAFIDEIVTHIESKNWGQLFRATCRTGENQPLRAFDQICDAIADRYMQSDREPIELSPTDASIVKEAFPVLSNVLHTNMQFSPAESQPESSGQPKAAVHLSEQLRLVGPLFLVIDDSQWADEDSRRVLDFLSRATGPEGLGIITVSRGSESYRVPADMTVQLGPLNVDHSIALLTRSVERWQVSLSESLKEQLVLACDCIPYRICQVANELRPNGILSNSDDQAVAAFLTHKSIQDDWKRRAELISPDAKSVLQFVATAGGGCSTLQLGELTGLKDSIDAAVSELAHQSLVRDQATGGECIYIFHDEIGDFMLASMSDQDIQQAHHAWATHLARQENSHLQASRIAGHFFSAGEPGRAVSHAVLAAEDAEKRTANYEAARLYKRVAQYVKGEEKTNQLRNAARCFRSSGYHVESAECFNALADLLDQDEQFECRLMALTLLTQVGRLDDVRTQLRDMSGALGLPRPKPRLLAIGAVLIRGSLLAMRGKGALLDRLIEQTSSTENTSIPLNRKMQQRLNLCFSLVRPLSFGDNLYAAELSLYGTRLLLKHADTQLRIHAAVGESVFACYDNTQRRTAAENRLDQLTKIADKIGDDGSKGDVASGIALSHGLAGRWSEVESPVLKCVQLYEQSSDPRGFEIAHSKWVHLWAMWHLGQWRQLSRSGSDLYSDAVSRDDRFQQQIACTGFSAGAWLALDDLSMLDKIQHEHYQTAGNRNQLQLFDVLNWAGLTLRKIYGGKYDEAWEGYEKIKLQLRRMPFSSLQMVRVMSRQLAVVVALHQLNLNFTEQGYLRTDLLVRQLRAEATPFTSMLANLYGGLLTLRVAQIHNNQATAIHAIGLFAKARGEATEQRLLPFQLAASDSIVAAETGTPSELLLDQMKANGVAAPVKFQRLFTVDKFC